jgi:MFS family permease
MTGISAFCSGMLADQFGRRTNFTLSGLFSTAGITILYISSMRGVFLAAKIINVFSLGLAVATGQTYISEIAPTRLRGILLSGYVLCLVSFLSCPAPVERFVRIKINLGIRLSACLQRDTSPWRGLHGCLILHTRI